MKLFKTTRLTKENFNIVNGNVEYLDYEINNPWYCVAVLQHKVSGKYELYHRSYVTDETMPDFEDVSDFDDALSKANEFLQTVHRNCAKIIEEHRKEYRFILNEHGNITCKTDWTDCEICTNGNGNVHIMISQPNYWANRYDMVFNNEKFFTTVEQAICFYMLYDLLR